MLAAGEATEDEVREGPVPLEAAGAVIGTGNAPAVAPVM